MNVNPHLSPGRGASPDGDAAGDAELWRRFADPAGDEEFYAAWITILCRKAGGVRSAVLLVSDSETGGMAPLAVYPHPAADVSHLREAAASALRSGSGVLHRPEGGDSAHLAYPIRIGDEVTGIAVLELAAAADNVLVEARRSVLWGVGWLEAAVWRRRAESDSARVERAARALDLLGVAEEHPRLEAAAMAVANELAGRLDLARVAIGLYPRARRGNRPIRICGLSSTAWFPKKSPTVRLITNAMEEALDQNASVVFPAPESGRGPIVVAHAELSRNEKGRSVASIVMLDRNAPVGAILIEKDGDNPVDAETLRVCEAIAALLGPVLSLKARQQRWVSGRIVDALGDGLKAVLGPRRPSLKIATAAVLGAALFICLYHKDFEVSAEAAVEGLVQRNAVAPFAGYIADAAVRAGDRVAKDQIIATLDDRDLRLEELKWQSEEAQLQRQRRRALAGLDRAEAALLSAQIRQAQAQIRLAAEKRRRTVIRAPLDGVVLTGDLSQKLGAPVEQGETLFVIAPLDRFRVIAQVAEGDLRHVREGQPGRLRLSGIADREFPVEVRKVTSVAGVVDGQNTFRVEASIGDTGNLVRPGMEGVAKIAVDERPLIWIWTRGLVEWLRYFVWKWVP